jgi:peptidoglycan/LPS O-acetylase OafA/YrhL
MAVYRKEVDGLRAIAVMSVIFFHLGLSFPGGFVGVDIFLVISGYLITSLIFPQIQNGTFQYFRFLERRARRLAPALLVVVFTSMLLAWIFLLPIQLQEFGRSVRSVLGLYSNLFFYGNSGYFDAAAAKQPLLHIWSLSLEEQFYLIFPVASIIVYKLFRTKFISWLIFSFVLASGLSFLMNIWGINNAPNAIYYLLPFRVWEFLIGSIVAVSLEQRKDHNTAKYGSFLALVGLLIIAISFFYLDERVPFPGFAALMPVLGTALVLLYIKEGTSIYSGLSHPILVHIGLLSYPLYLWHQPLLVYGREIEIDFTEAVPAVSLILSTFILSGITYKFIELPVRSSKVLPKWKFLIFVISVCAFLIAVTFQIESRDGFPSRYDNRYGGEVGHIEFHELLDNNYLDCEPKNIAAQALYWKDYLRCKQTQKGLPEIVLLGDSHAEHLFLGLAQSIPSKNIAFYIKGERPFLSRPEFSEVFRELLSNKKDQIVLFTYAFTSRSNDVSDLEKEVEETIVALKDRRKDVYIIGDIPSFPFDAAACKYQGSILKRQNSCTIDANLHRIGADAVESSLRKISTRLRVPYISLDQFFCDITVCSMVKDKTLLYRDSNHLNIAGSRLVGNYLSQLIKLQAKKAG